MIRRDDVRSVELVKTRAKRIGHKVGAVQGSFDLLFFAGRLIAGRFYRVGVPAPLGGNNNA